MFEEDINNKIYNLIITKGVDSENQHSEFLNKLYKKTNFLWKESLSGSYKYAGEDFYNKVDCIIILAGLYEKNKETIDELIEASEKYKIPVVLVRPYGLEEVPENLEKIATSIVGWNANCIVDSIVGSVKESKYHCE